MTPTAPHSPGTVRIGNIAMWLGLMVPAIPILWPVLIGGEPWRHAIRPSGYAAVVMLVLALAIQPLLKFFPTAGALRWLQRRRRAIGLACFAYSAIHLAVFSASIGRLDHILQGMAFTSMWTGWAAFALLLIVAMVSNNPLMRRLGPRWKRVQRLVHPAAILVFAHWMLLSRSPVEAIAWFLPLALLQGLRLFRAARTGRRGAIDNRRT